MNTEKTEPTPGTGDHSRRPIRLPGFVADTELGLGDAIKRAGA